MLTFEQALLLLKSGEDMRLPAWPRQAFVRVTTGAGGRPTLTRFDGRARVPYVPSDADLFSNAWSKA